MSHITTTHGHHGSAYAYSGTARSFSNVAIVTRAIAAIRRYHDYKKTVRELSALSDHMLADIGVHRSEIQFMAHQATFEDNRGRLYR